MLRVVCEPQHRLYVHIDKKSNWSPARFKRELATITEPECTYGQVHVAKRHNIGWGKVNEVYPLMDCMQMVVEQQWSFDFLFPVSGQDFPLVDRQTLENRLAKVKGKSWFGRWQKLTNQNGRMWKNLKDKRVDCVDRRCTRMKLTPGGKHCYKGTPNYYLGRNMVQEFVDTCSGRDWIFSRASMIERGGQLMLMLLR